MTRTAPARPASAGTAILDEAVLAVVLAAGLFLVVMPLVELLHRPSPLPPPLPAIGVPSQNQGAETLTYLLTFGVITPLAIVLAPRLVRGRGATALLAAGLALAVLGVKAAGALGLGDGVVAVLVAGALWWLAAAVVLRRPWPALQARAGTVEAIAAVLVLGTLLCFTALRSISPVGLVLGALAAAAALVVPARRRLPAPGRRLGPALDVLVVVLVALAIPDLVIFEPEAARTSLVLTLQDGIFQFHHDFLLGPANEVLHGGAMLVDVASQYGVGSIDALVAWFHLVPIGYGTLGFLDGLLTAGWFVAGYAILRLARTSRTIAAAALGLGVVVLVDNLAYPVGALPQDGPLRFGMPMLALLFLVGAERRTRRAPLWSAGALATVALASIWSLEALAYTGAVFGLVLVVRAALDRDDGRVRRAGISALMALGACVAAHLAFALITLAWTGHPPDWGHYLAFLHQFLSGGLGEVTYDVSRWTPALVVGAGYVASAVGVVALVRTRTLGDAERPAVVALAGLTGYGIVLLSYYVDRSQDQILMHVSLPGLLVAAMWLGLLVRRGDGVPEPLRRALVAATLGVAVLLLSVAWSSAGERLGRTALVRALPGGAPLRASLDRLWHLPAVESGTPPGEALLERAMPGERRSLVMASPDLETELLLRTGRADRLRLADPIQASFVPDDQLPQLRRQVDSLRPGTRMLLDRRGVRQLALLRAHPGLRPLARAPGQAAPDAGLLLRELAPLQVWALQRIERRFRLVTVARGPRNYRVVELRSKR